MPLFTVQNLSLGYGARVVAGGLSFTVSAGDYLCIVGENGSGKTTLMKTLLGLKAPAGGQVLVGDGLRRDEIGYLPQQTLVQRDFPATVREIVLSGCQGRCGMRSFYNRAEKELAAEAMGRMGIWALRSRCYRELSGGQQQRVLLARAFCAARKVLFLDEPVSGLDPEATAELYERIDSLSRGGLTILQISHDLGAAMRYASHILRMGDPVFFGTREEYREALAGKEEG